MFTATQQQSSCFMPQPPHKKKNAFCNPACNDFAQDAAGDSRHAATPPGSHVGKPYVLRPNLALDESGG